MRKANAAPLVALLVATFFARPAHASTAAGRTAPPEPSTSSVVASTSSVDAVKDLWQLFQQLRGDNQDSTPPAIRPRPIPLAGADGPVMDLSSLERPAELERQLIQLGQVPDSALQVRVPGGQARAGAFSIGSDQTQTGHLLVFRGNAEVFGRLQGNLVTYAGNVVLHPGAVVAGDVLAVHGTIYNRGGEVQGETMTLAAVPPSRRAAEPETSALTLTIRRLSGVIGVFLTLAAIGWGIAAFGQHHLQVVSDTASHNFGRAFLTGLVGQILVLPTFGMLIVGLVLSVVGILLLPFAVVVFALLVVVGVLGGFLAVTHAMGETYTRRRMAAGLALGAPGHMQFLAVGLAGVVVLWLAWALFGWVPVAGALIRAAALLVTWVLATAGFGAALLSRAGIKEGFAGRIIPPEALTDEYLWATPRYGVQAVQRPGAPTPPPPGR